MVVQSTVWHVIDLPGQGSRPRHVNHTLGIKQVGLHQWIRGIDKTHTIRYEAVSVEIGFERRGRDAPYALIILLHEQRLRVLAFEQDLFGVWIPEPEGN